MSTKDKNNTGRAAASESKATATQNTTPPLPAQYDPAGANLPRLAFTMRETAKILGVSYITVHRLLQRGKLRASDAIRNKMIPKTEIERFLRDSLATN